MILHDVLWALGDFAPFVVEAKLQDESCVRVFPVGFKLVTKDFMKFMSMDKENLRKFALCEVASIDIGEEWEGDSCREPYLIIYLKGRLENSPKKTERRNGHGDCERTGKSVTGGGDHSAAK